jgi:NADH:ubiquinone oxidoreductase subunit H
MAFGWKLLLPLSIVNVIVTSFVILAKMTWGAK